MGIVAWDTPINRERSHTVRAEIVCGRIAKCLDISSMLVASSEMKAVGAIFPVAKLGRLGKYFALGLELLMLVRILEPAR
jgi:hypothetical protein